MFMLVLNDYLWEQVWGALGNHIPKAEGGLAPEGLKRCYWTPKLFQLERRKGQWK